MAAVTQPTLLTPSAQFKEFFSALGTLFSSVCERTDDAFRRVNVLKRDANGAVKSYLNTDPLTGEKKTITVLSYLEDTRTGKLYMYEENYITSVKCFLLTLGIPFYTLGKMCWFACKAPIEMTALTIDAFTKTGNRFYSGKFNEGLTELRNGVTQVGESFADGLFELVKAPLFGLGAELAAVYGIFRAPFGKRAESLIEHAWQKGVTYKEVARGVQARQGEHCLQSFINDIRESHPFYLAQCFQERGHISNPRLIILSRQPYR
jgi:hypothetical protein